MLRKKIRIGSLSHLYSIWRTLSKAGVVVSKSYSILTEPEDRIVRVTDKVTNGVTNNVADQELQLLQLQKEDSG